MDGKTHRGAQRAVAVRLGPLLAAALATALALAACGGGSDDAPRPEPRVPAPPPAEPEPAGERAAMPEERRFADAFAREIAADVKKHGPDRPLVRAVIRWFEPQDPLYFTVHVLTARDRADVPPENAWYPLEWPNVDEEMRRTERLAANRAIDEAGRPLAGRYESDPALHEDGEASGELPAPSRAVLETVRRLPGALRDAGVALHDELAVSAANFEGFGAGSVLRQTAQPGVIAALDARGELPAE